METESILNFKIPEFSEIENIKKYITNFGQSHSCEETIATLYLWWEFYGEKYALSGDTLYISAEFDGELSFMLPFGRDIKQGVENLKNYAHKRDFKLCFFAPEGKRFDEFVKIFGDEFDITESRDDFEYIYNSKDLINLTGKKYHSKRNHISAFGKKYNWSYEDITEENLNDVLNMADRWLAGAEHPDDPSLICENRAIKRVLPKFAELGIKGGLIRVEGEVVAFTFGNPINSETFCLNIEKAMWDFRSAYTLINREFAAAALSQYKFINREDDLGLEGLRKSKLSYYPAKLLKKYVIREK